ncbi:MAG: hypothetical protein R3351_05745, partial [Nitrospirales bacterium]|nr:hypothetical protein [Nitrospirales bacterium]
IGPGRQHYPHQHQVTTAEEQLQPAGRSDYASATDLLINRRAAARCPPDLRPAAKKTTPGHSPNSPSSSKPRHGRRETHKKPHQYSKTIQDFFSPSTDASPCRHPHSLQTDPAPACPGKKSSNSIG